MQQRRLQPYRSSLINIWVRYGSNLSVRRYSQWSKFSPLMEQYGEEQDCDPAGLAWYLESRRVYQTDRPISVNHSIACAPDQQGLT